MTIVIAATSAALAQAAELAAQGEAVRVLRVGNLRGQGAAPVRGAADLSALRRVWGPVAWVPPHARRSILEAGAFRGLRRFRRAAERHLEGRVPGLHLQHRGDWVVPARGWGEVERRQIEGIQRAGGDVVEAEVEALEVEDGRVVAVETAFGLEWVDRVVTDVDPRQVVAWTTRAEAPVGLGAAEVVLNATTQAAWETLLPRGEVFRVCRSLLDDQQLVVHVLARARAQHHALLAVRDFADVVGVLGTRSGAAGHGDARSLAAIRGLGVEWVSPSL